jgi:GT2 family glycosyltransferase
MDRLFRPAYEEDRDLSYRARKSGWQVLFEPKSLVHHHHETTNIRALGAMKIKVVSFKNQFLFVWKNITDSGYLLKHLFWCPYHLTVTNFRSGGLLFLGFLMALRQLPETLQSRRRAKRLFVRKDSDLI